MAMRIQFVIPAKLPVEATSFAEGLRTSMQKKYGSEVELIDQHPDIIHIFGVWNYQSAQTVIKSAQLQIPVVYSPMGDLTPWNKEKHPAGQHKNALRKAIQCADLIHVTGPSERTVIEEMTAKHARIFLMPNPVVTMAISFDSCATIVHEEYRKLINQREEFKQKEIRGLLSSNNIKESIADICSNVLYLQYMNHRQTLPLSHLHTLSSLLTSSDYDESAFPKILKKLGIDVFFPRLEQLMEENSHLTEGFMPVSPINDKTTQLMRSHLFDDTAEKA